LWGSFKIIFIFLTTIGFYQQGKDIEDLVIEARKCIRKGFTGIKIKAGKNSYGVAGLSEPTVLERSGLCLAENDVERVAAVREAIGDDIDLMVDANCAWKPHTAIMMARKFERYNYSWDRRTRCPR